MFKISKYKDSCFGTFLMYDSHLNFLLSIHCFELFGWAPQRGIFTPLHRYPLYLSAPLCVHICTPQGKVLLWPLPGSQPTSSSVQFSSGIPSYKTRSSIMTQYPLQKIIWLPQIMLICKLCN